MVGRRKKLAVRLLLAKSTNVELEEIMQYADKSKATMWSWVHICDGGPGNYHCLFWMIEMFKILLGFFSNLLLIPQVTDMTLAKETQSSFEEYLTSTWPIFWGHWVILQYVCIKAYDTFWKIERLWPLKVPTMVNKPISLHLFSISRSKMLSWVNKKIL